MAAGVIGRGRVLIVGGGLAGLAAAVALADDFEVTLLERRAVLGGRASSFVDDDTGEAVDNCQHVLMRCCTNLLDLYARLGVSDQLRFYDSFQFINPDGTTAQLGGAPLPAPLHLAPALLGFRLLSLGERMLVADALLKLVQQSSHPTLHLTFGEWLRCHRQSARVIEHFWAPVIVSALNEEVDRVAFQYARQVFVEGFMATRHSYEMGLPTRPLHELYDPAVAFVAQRCGTVQLDVPVREFIFNGDRANGVRLMDGSTIEADSIIAAVPFEVLLRLVPSDLVEQHVCFANLRRLEHSPIVAVHVWFDREVTDLDHAALTGRTVQWMFNKSRNFTTRGRGDAETGGNGDYLGLVVSAARALIDKTRSEIIEVALADVREAFPRAREAKVTRAVVIKEPRATFACTPESEALRPDQQTPLANFFLAGDWTNTGWPPTMEGAVISGYRAAERVFASRGAPREVERPKLEPDGLMPWLQMRSGDAS